MKRCLSLSKRIIFRFKQFHWIPFFSGRRLGVNQGDFQQFLISRTTALELFWKALGSPFLTPNVRGPGNPGVLRSQTSPFFCGLVASKSLNWKVQKRDLCKMLVECFKGLKKLVLSLVLFRTSAQTRIKPVAVPERKGWHGKVQKQVKF